MKIIYYGTPDFAVAPLKKLIEHAFNIVAVVTMPDKPAGRGYDIQQSPVKKFALEQKLEVLQPTNLKSSEFIETIKKINPDLQIVVAFRMLPEIVWNFPRLGTFNLHASLLPQYRGAAPINWAIINGETKTGVTTFFLKHQIDTGAIILQEQVEITPTETAGTLHDKLMLVGADLVLKTVQQIQSGDCYSTPQQETSQLKHAPKIFKEDCKIEWNETSLKIYNKIRGLSPYPAAFSNLNIAGKEMLLKIYEATIIEKTNTDEQPGKMIIKHNSIEVATKDGWLSLLHIQLSGKKRMSVVEFLKGFKTNEDITLY
jgi:methionyl-tRNA formyltransferase